MSLSRREVLAAPFALLATGAGYSHVKRSRTLPAGRWVTLATVPMPVRGWVGVTYQIPLHDAAKGTVARVRLVRLPAEDGTGDDSRLIGDDRWNIRNGHILRGFRGDLALRVKVTRRVTVPYTILKAVPIR
jgi:hypothetical protein